MTVLIVTAVKQESAAITPIAGAKVIIAGVGRTNAAHATTKEIVRNGPYDAVLNAGVAGALPGSGLEIGDVLVSSACVYAEEGIITPHGFVDIESIGFALGDFAGNAVPVDEVLLEVLGARFRIGPIATVATCSGTDAAAASVASRTDALAEAMEGAAVVHVARRLYHSAIELRAISNQTGDRSNQQWNLDTAFEALHDATHEAVQLIRESGRFEAIRIED